MLFNGSNWLVFPPPFSPYSLVYNSNANVNVSKNEPIPLASLNHESSEGNHATIEQNHGNIDPILEEKKKEKVNKIDDDFRPKAQNSKKKNKTKQI